MMEYRSYIAHTCYLVKLTSGHVTSAPTSEEISELCRHQEATIHHPPPSLGPQHLAGNEYTRRARLRICA